MTDPTRPPVARVRVTGPARRRTPAPRAAAADIDAGTRLGEVYVASLLRAQLGLALRVLAVLVIGVAGLPLLFHLLPGLAGVSVLGLPLAWVLLGGLVYPFLVLLGWWYVRRAEQHEEDFAELLGRPDPDEEAGS